MGNEKPSYPEVEIEDPEAVSAALISGATSWKEGNEREALRWLQRATLAATRANLTKRAGVLAQTVARISTALGGQLLKVPQLSKLSSSGATLETDFSDTTVVDGSPETIPITKAKIVDDSLQKPRQALRVAVEPAPGEPNILRIQLLEDGRAPAPGAHEAFLVPVEAGVDFTRRRES